MDLYLLKELMARSGFVPVKGVDGEEWVAQHRDDQLSHGQVHEEVVKRCSQLKIQGKFS